MIRDWLHVRSQLPEVGFGRILLATPHEVGIYVAASIQYGAFIETVDHGRVLPMLKKVISKTVRDAITETSIA